MKKSIILLSVLILCLSCQQNKTIIEEPLNTWLIQNYVDELGDPTNKRFFYTNCFGTFSNSTSNSSELRVRVDVTKIEVVPNEWLSYIEFHLFEYGEYRPSIINKFGDKVKVSLKFNDEIYYLTYKGLSTDWPSGSEMLADKMTKECYSLLLTKEIYNLLIRGKIIKFKIRNLATKNDYYFDLDTRGFQKNYIKTYGIYK